MGVGGMKPIILKNTTIAIFSNNFIIEEFGESVKVTKGTFYDFIPTTFNEIVKSISPYEHIVLTK